MIDLKDYRPSLSRLIAALWFGLAGAAVSLALLRKQTGIVEDAPILLIASAFFTATLTGFLLGHNILNPDLVQDWGAAVAHGVRVSLSALALYLIICFASMLLSGLLQAACAFVIFGLIVGVFPVMIAGGIAGWLLYRLGILARHIDQNYCKHSMCHETW